MKLSIITINFNNLVGLRKTFESVVSQTFNDYEWIIIDGGSLDGSKEFIEEHQNIFTWWCSEKDNGVYNAMNKGISKASGTYLNFLNSGDCYMDSETLDKFFRNDLNGDVIYGDWVRQYSDHSEFVEALKNSFDRLAYFRNICHQAMFIRTDVQKKHLYDESFRALADLKLWCELPFEGYRFQYVPVTICRFWAENGLTSAPGSYERNLPERLRILQSEKIPSEYRDWVLNYLKEHEKFAFCEYNMLTSSTYDLIHERRIYRRLIKLNILMLKCLKKVLDSINPMKSV